MKYLKNINTLEQLKREFHSWAMKLHPDCGGSEKDMQALNAEYDKLFHLVKCKHQKASGEEFYKNYYEAPNQFKELIDSLLKLNNIKIEVIGCFVWVSGDTKPHKDSLKKLGFKWHAKKKVWYLSPNEYRRFGKKEYSLDAIRKMYGVQYEGSVKQDALTAASPA